MVLSTEVTASGLSMFNTASGGMFWYYQWRLLLAVLVEADLVPAGAQVLLLPIFVGDGFSTVGGGVVWRYWGIFADVRVRRRRI